MIEKEFVRKFSNRALTLTETAELAKDTDPVNGLALRAHNYLNTLIELENYLEKIGFNSRTPFR